MLLHVDFLITKHNGGILWSLSRCIYYYYDNRNISDITTFQETIAKPFITHLKDISRRFASSGDVLSALSILDPKKVPVDSDDLSHYGEASISTLLAYYGRQIRRDIPGRGNGKGSNDLL